VSVFERIEKMYRTIRLIISCAVAMLVQLNYGIGDIENIANSDDLMAQNIALCRDPFTLKQAEKDILLISILSDANPVVSEGYSGQSKKTAIVEYDNESILVSVGDLIGVQWQVISIDDKEIVLESLESKKRKTVLLDYD
jgi:hypothetical protein